MHESTLQLSRGKTKHRTKRTRDLRDRSIDICFLDAHTPRKTSLDSAQPQPHRPKIPFSLPTTPPPPSLSSPSPLSSILPLLALCLKIIPEHTSVPRTYAGQTPKKCVTVRKPPWFEEPFNGSQSCQGAVDHVECKWLFHTEKATMADRRGGNSTTSFQGIFQPLESCLRNCK